MTRNAKDREARIQGTGASAVWSLSRILDANVPARIPRNSSAQLSSALLTLTWLSYSTPTPLSFNFRHSVLYSLFCILDSVDLNRETFCSGVNSQKHRFPTSASVCSLLRPAPRSAFLSPTTGLWIDLVSSFCAVLRANSTVVRLY